MDKLGSAITMLTDSEILTELERRGWQVRGVQPGMGNAPLITEWSRDHGLQTFAIFNLLVPSDTLRAISRRGETS